MRASAGIITFTLLLVSNASTATQFSADSILVSKSNAIYEYTSAGQLIQSMPVENRFGVVPTVTDNYGRDLVVGTGGDLHVFNMTPDTYGQIGSISTYNVNTNDWTHRAADLSLRAGGGGIAFLDGTVFAADPQSGGGGIYTFESSTYNILSLAYGPYDLNIGLDGYLYTLSNDYYNHKFITKYDPTTLNYLGSLQVDNNSEALAVDAQGSIFLAVGGSINQMNFDGTLVNSASFAIGTHEVIPGLFANDYCSYTDMDISTSGDLLLGCSGGQVLMTDTSLNNFSFFDTGDQPVYVAFSDTSLSAVPLPAAFWLFGSGITCLLCVSKRNNA